MFEPLILHVIPDVDGRWRVALHHLSLRPAWADLHADRVSQLVDEVNVALSPEGLPAMLPPNRDAPFVAQEERAGRALALVLHVSVSTTTALAEARLRARQAGVPVALVVAAEGAAADLPWELLADAPDGVGLAATGAAVIVRLVNGPSAEPRAGAWSWDAASLDERDPLLSGLMERVSQIASRVGLPRRGPGEVGGPRLQVLAGHGERDLVALTLVTAAGVVAPQAALAAVTTRADFGVLAVCDAGPRDASLVSEPVDLLLRSGWGAVIAPRGRVLVEGCAILCEALMSSLSRGASLLRATQEARRTLRARALAMPEGRWHRWGLYITDLRQVTSAVTHVATAPRLALGWPGLAPEAEALVARAIELSEQIGSGFLGLEHLALAVVTSPPEGQTFQWRAQLLRIQEQISQQLGGFTAISEARPCPTPRLRAMASELKAGASSGDLRRVLQDVEVWRQLYLAARWPWPQDRNGETIHTLPVIGADETAALGLSLEVLGGPEDGLVLRPTPGDVLGRGDDGPRTTLRLYQTTDAYDGRLSRTHLEFVSPTCARALRRLELGRRGKPLQVQQGQELELAHGDLLRLTPYTQLLVREGPA